MRWFKNIFNSEGSKRESLASKKEVKPGDMALSLAVVAFIFGVLLSSSNLTGNAIGNLSQTTSNWIGVGIFAIGLVGIFVYLKKKSKRKIKKIISKRKTKKKRK